jgi:ubiquinol-cytochrome c reductase cytochrome c subunit
VRTPLLLAALVFAASIAVAETPAPPSAQAAPTGHAETGRKLYVSYGCWQCHGYEGQGGAAGPRLAWRPLPLAGFTRYVRRPTNQMPPYTEKVVSDMDLVHIHAFLASRPAPPSVQSIPLLQK